MLHRLAAAMFALGCTGTAFAGDTAAPTPQSAVCDALDAEYSLTIMNLDQNVEAAFAIAKNERSERNWLNAREALADLAASQADYMSLHTERNCSSKRFSLPEPWERESPVDRSVKPFLLQFTRDVAATAGIGVLENVVVPEGETEIRIWIGFGSIEPGHMLRLRVERTGEVTGDVLVYFSHDLARRIAEGLTAEQALEFWNDVIGSCGAVREGVIDDACFAKPSRSTDWRAIHEKLVTMGIETLPDQDELPPDDVEVFDGVSMVVEVRKGARYRAYEYANPGFHQQPEAQAAAQIIELAAKTVHGATD